MSRREPIEILRVCLRKNICGAISVWPLSFGFVFDGDQVCTLFCSMTIAIQILFCYPKGTARYLKKNTYFCDFDLFSILSFV